MADALDAMTSQRPYRHRISIEEAAAEIRRCSGIQFDSRVVDAFLDAVKKGRVTVVNAAHPTVLEHEPS